MALTDVTRPVVINTTLYQRLQVENWIRKVCFVSVGQSLLAPGTSQKVTKSNYKEYITEAEELTTRLTTFFNYAGDTKAAYILETGPQEGSPLDDTYANQYKYAKEQELFTDLDYYTYLYNEKFAYPKQFEQGVESSTMIYVSTPKITMTTGAEQKVTVTTNASIWNVIFQNDNIDVTVNGKKEEGDGSEKNITVIGNSEEITITGKKAGIATLTIKAKHGESTELTQTITIEQIDEFGEAKKDLETKKFAEYTTVYYESKQNLINWYNYAYNNGWNEGQYTVFYTNNRLNDDPSSVKLYFDSIIYNWKDDYINYVANNVNTFASLFIKENIAAYLATQSWYSEAAYAQWLVDNGNFNTDYTQKIDIIRKFIDDCKERYYIYVLPEQLNKYGLLRNTLISAYGGLNDSTYFFTDYKITDKDTLSTSPEIFSEIVGNKSEFSVIDNVVSKTPMLSAAIAGLFASQKFDFSVDNPASPFNFKFLTGVQIEEFSRDEKLKLIDASLNFVDTLANQNCLMNGRCKDTYPFDYWYQWDYLAFTLDYDIKNLILTGVNNPKYVIRYNQNGIDTLKARVLATLNNCVSLGLVTEFSESIDPTDGSIVNRDMIQAIPYAEYIAANPDDYQNEIYGGISFFVRIGRYIRQVVMNVTIG